MIDDEDFPEKIEEPNIDILKSPYQSICNFAENRLKHVGHKIFSLLSLVPVSLLSPRLSYEDTSIKTGINAMFLAPPGAGKSFSVSMMKDISYNPFNFDAITSAGIEESLFGKENVTILVQDMSRILADPILIKQLENLTGEEQMGGSITVKRGDKRFNLNSVSFLAGVPSDISENISSGLIFRFTPILIMNSLDTQKKIGKDIAMSIGSHSAKNLTIDEIKKFYNWLYYIQLGRNKDFKRVDGYIISDEQKKAINERWEKAMHIADAPTLFNWFREELDGFRFMCSSAMLNIYNRKIEEENGKRMIIPDDQDLRVGMFLMSEEIKLKSHLLRCDKIARRITDIKYLERYNERNKVNNLTMELINLLAKKNQA